MKKKMGKYWILAGMVLCLAGCTEKTDGKTETEQTVLEQEMSSGEQEAVAGSLRAVTGDTGGEWMIDGDGTAVSRRYEDIWEEDIRSRRETARYTEGGKTGYFSVSSGEILIPAQYAEASRMEDKGAVVGDGNKKWLIDEQGRRVSDEYDDLKQPDQGWIAAKQSKWGIVDQDDKEIIPFEYDSLYLQTIFAAALAEKEGIAYYIFFGEGEPQITELGPYEIGPVYEEGWSVIHDRDGSGGIIGWNGDVYFRSDCSLTIARNTEDGVYLLSSQGDDGRYGAVCFWAEERRASELVPPVYS